MRSTARTVPMQPDKRFLFWVLASLVAGTMTTGIIAVITAMMMAGLQ